MFTCAYLTTTPETINFIINGSGSMLVTVFLLAPFLLYTYYLKEQNAYNRGQTLNFWSSKGSGMLLGWISIQLYKMIDAFIIQLPIVYINVFIGFAFLPFYAKEIKIYNFEKQYRTQTQPIATNFIVPPQHSTIKARLFFENEILRGRPVHKWNSRKYKKELTKAIKINQNLNNRLNKKSEL